MGKTVTEQVEGVLQTLGWKHNDCDCDDCRSMCRTPCTPTPEEVVRIVEAGYADRLMPTTTVLAHIGYVDETLSPRRVDDSEGCRCVFQENGLCVLHERGLKPLEGRYASCKSGRGDELRVVVGQSWKTRLGAEILTAVNSGR